MKIFLKFQIYYVVVVFWKIDVIALRPYRAIDLLNSKGRNDDDKLAHDVSFSEHDVKELYIEQPLDHFSPRRNKFTFRQRYFYSDRFVVDRQDKKSNNDNDPSKNFLSSQPPTHVFLCVGGEGPSLDKSVLVDSVHCTGDMLELARILHEDEQASVHLFSLEHRYYGKSYPDFSSKKGNSTNPVANENLLHLSSRQALADLAHFIETQKIERQFDRSARWITFGGSYPGMLAAWARLLYPDLVFASVSNSAPVQVVLDMTSYYDRVAMDLQYEGVGGSKECLQRTMDGHAQILEELQKGNHESVASLFHICGGGNSLLNQKYVDMWVGDGVVEVPAQSDSPDCGQGLCNIANLCDEIVKTRKDNATAMESLAIVASMQSRAPHCTPVDWNATLAFLASPEEAQKDGLRSWLWQTCTEMGFYQTCEQRTMCPYGRGRHTLSMDFEICRVAFGIEPHDVARNVQATLEYYGGWDLNATRVLSVNGNIDPWSAQAITGSRGNSTLRPTHWVKGASHHYWTHKVKHGDSQEVIDARNIIYAKVMEWLEKDTFVAFTQPTEMLVSDT